MLAMAESKKYDIKVEVRTEYLPDQSDTAASRFVFAYHITISNVGNMPSQLISRHWVITDADGAVQEVKGLGVVGHQPLLQPSQSFEYTSGCPLGTPSGIMAGSYQMTTDGGGRFDIEIPAVSLDSPYDTAAIN